MSEAIEPFVLPQAERARALPLSQRTRDLALPLVVGLSLMVHATVLIPLLFQGKKAGGPGPTEIPVEIIQEPAKPKPPPEAAKPTPPPKPVAQQEPPKQGPKPETPKKEPPKPPQKSPDQAKQAEAQARVAERMRKLLGQTSSLDPVALPGESANGTEGASYQQLVMSKLTKALSLEPRRGVPGAAVVTFVLDDQGGVASVTINRTSGDADLDNEAMTVIRKGSPYPSPPPGGKRDYTVTYERRPIL